MSPDIATPDFSIFHSHFEKIFGNLLESRPNKTGVVNDPLSQTHSFAGSEHCFHLKFVLFC